MKRLYKVGKTFAIIWSNTLILPNFHLYFYWGTARTQESVHILNSSMTHVYTFVTTAKNRMQNVSMTPDFLLRLLDQYLHHPCQSNHYSDFYQHRFILSVLELYTNFIIHCVLLSSACFERFNAFIASQCHNTRSLDFCVFFCCVVILYKYAIIYLLFSW